MKNNKKKNCNVIDLLLLFDNKSLKIKILKSIYLCNETNFI